MKGNVAQGVSKLKTKATVKPNIIYIRASFINSETTALLHLTSFIEGMTNIGFHMSIWEIFSEFFRFCNSFQEPLGEGNNIKIRETRKIFANIA